MLGIAAEHLVVVPELGAVESLELQRVRRRQDVRRADRYDDTRVPVEEVDVVDSVGFEDLVGFETGQRFIWLLSFEIRFENEKEKETESASA
jgi:hypothetical protein